MPGEQAGLPRYPRVACNGPASVGAAATAWEDGMHGAGKYPGASPAAENLLSLPTRGGSGSRVSIVVFSVVAPIAARVIDADTIEVAGERAAPP